MHGKGKGNSYEKRELRRDEPFYRDALRLRYTVFFEPHGLGPGVVQDELESSSRHFSLVQDDRLLACARLTLFTSGVAKMSQMVVSPACRRQGLGSALLQWIIEVCQGEQVRTIELEARSEKIGFYTRHGFRCRGESYPSRRTGIPHVHMERILRDPKR